MKKIYGIDLGTTNSGIAYAGQMIGGLVPSIVDLGEKRAGEHLREKFDTVRSFKVDISCGAEGKTSIAASSVVLRELVNQVYATTGETVEEVVVAVPAFFSDNQRQATRQAAELIGLTVRGLINEPTAAAIYYNKDLRKVAVIYDLGGGTFDVSVIDSRLGMYDIQATDGIILGGDDLDNNLRNFIVKRAKVKLHKLTSQDRLRLKQKCEQAKIQIQKERQDIRSEERRVGKECRYRW